MKEWALSNLRKLGFPEAEDLLLYMLSADDEELVKDYLNSMLNSNNQAHKKFIDEFIKRHQESKHKYNVDNMPATSTPKTKGKSETSPVGSQSSSKKKSKYVSIYSDKADSSNVIMLPGRHKCDCQALKHGLINNCLKCGKIVCEQEGSGRCSFCGNLVVSKEEQEILNRKSKKSEALQNTLLNKKKLNNLSEDSKLEKAIEHKNKLLEYDKTSEKRTRVYDDQSDYFHSGSTWIKPENRTKLQELENNMQEQKHARPTKFTIDLLGRKIVTTQDTNGMEDAQINQLLNEEKPLYKTDLRDCASLISISRPVFIGCDDNFHKESRQPVLINKNRVQDKLMQEMSDDGMCMSMHQPWASLLVMGIKVHEGRVWYSSHRGRLWIASGSKVPSESEIKQVEEIYQSLHRCKNLKFPRHYPAGVLLGCVDVVDVLPQEEYRLSFPEGESESPFVFVCESPREMVVKFPIKGQHKIYKLDSKIHKAARKSINELS